MSTKLIPATDKHMCRNSIFLPRGKHFYPSESSARWIDSHGISRVAGTCLRQAWYRLSGKFKPSEKDPYGMWIFALGKHVEEILVEQWKEMGVWIANNVRFYDAERNISGEVDCVLIDPESGEKYCVEVKSFYGYMATRDLCGNTKVTARPKTSQMLQALIYVDQGRKHGLWNYVKMVYYARDSAARNEFDLTLVEDGELLRPAVDGVIDYRFTMDDIYDRYEELKAAHEAGVPPPRDFELSWDTEKVNQRKAIGEVSKTAYEKFCKSPKKNPIGDWQCRYCGYAEHCWSDKD